MHPIISLKAIADSVQGMGYAGTAGMVWGWIIAMIFIQCIAMSMAELCSAMPTR
jgi:amino acid transporter